MDKNILEKHPYVIFTSLITESALEINYVKRWI